MSSFYDLVFDLPTINNDTEEAYNIFLVLINNYFVWFWLDLCSMLSIMYIILCFKYTSTINLQLDSMVILYQYLSLCKVYFLTLLLLSFIPSFYYLFFNKIQPLKFETFYIGLRNCQCWVGCHTIFSKNLWDLAILQTNLSKINFMHLCNGISLLSLL